MTRKFKSLTGSPIAVFLPNRPQPLAIPATPPFYGTEDTTEIMWLLGSPEAAEVEDEEQGKAQPEPERNKAVASPQQLKAGRMQGRGK